MKIEVSNPALFVSAYAARFLAQPLSEIVGKELYGAESAAIAYMDNKQYLVENQLPLAPRDLGEKWIDNDLDAPTPTLPIKAHLLAAAAYDAYELTQGMWYTIIVPLYSLFPLDLADILSLSDRVSQLLAPVYDDDERLLESLGRSDVRALLSDMRATASSVYQVAITMLGRECIRVDGEELRPTPSNLERVFAEMDRHISDFDECFNPLCLYAVEIERCTKT